MKIKLTTHPFLIIATLLVAFLASCSTSNKVVSSFGKRKYTKGYYFASAGKEKAVLPISSTAAISSNSPSIKGTDVSANNKKASIGSQAMVVSNVKYTKTFLPALPQTIAVSSPVKNIFTAIFPDQPGVPGHGTTAGSVDNSEYDDMASVAMYFGLAAIALIIISIAFSSVLFVQGSGDIIVVAIYLLALLAMILGFAGQKSKKYHGRATVGKVIGLSIIIGTLLLIFLVFAFVAFLGLI